MGSGEIEAMLEKLTKYVRRKGWEIENFVYGIDEAKAEEVLVLICTRKVGYRWN